MTETIKQWVLRPGQCVLVTVLVLSCGGPANPSPGSSDIATSPDVPPTTPPLTTDCRPVDHVWDPATEPMLLPCEPTSEPCDNIDNDADGFTDPHCGSMPCHSDADCTYGGLLPDADCNRHPTPSILLGDLPGGVCNQIDGVPGDESLELCWGMLCPPTLKCVQGDCIPPGDGLPGAECSSGADCPLNAGCIPVEAMTIGPSIGRCKWYCHEFACPDGIECNEDHWVNPDTGATHNTSVCYQGPTIFDDGACTNPNDLKLLNHSTMENEVNDCAAKSEGDRSASRACIEELTGLGPACAECFGDLGSCLFYSCRNLYGAETMDAFEQCVKDSCSEPFETCAGIQLFKK